MKNLLNLIKRHEENTRKLHNVIYTLKNTENLTKNNINNLENYLRNIHESMLIDLNTIKEIYSGVQNEN